MRKMEQILGILSCILALGEPALAQGIPAQPSELSTKPKPPPPGAACGKLEGHPGAQHAADGHHSSAQHRPGPAWPSLAVKVKIDPLEDAFDDFSIPCKYGGDELCGLQASKCDKVTASFDHSTVNGLAYLQFSDLVATSLQGTSGTQSCRFNAKASGGTYAYLRVLLHGNRLREWEPRQQLKGLGDAEQPQGEGEVQGAGRQQDLQGGGSAERPAARPSQGHHRLQLLRRLVRRGRFQGDPLLLRAVEPRHQDLQRRL